MKVLLATSPHIQHAAVLQNDFRPEPRVMYSFLPLGLLSLAGTLRARMPEARCELFDTNRRIASGEIPLDARFYRTLASEIAAQRPSVVGFMTECDSYHHVLRIASAVKQELTGVKIVLGGPHASAVAEKTILRCPDIDAVVEGEGEIAFHELLVSYLTGERHTSIPGVVERQLFDSSGPTLPVLDALRARNRPLVGNLDELAMPAFDMYRPAQGEEVFLEVGRGCPFECEFCSTAPFWQRKHRVKSPARIVEEVRTVQQLFGSQRVHFTHDLFTTARTWVMAVCDALIDAGRPVVWTCSARTDTVDEELLHRMAQAGCSAVYFGLESGSQRVLRDIRKEIPVERSFAAIEMCRQVGISPNVGFILGFPTEDDSSRTETFAAFERSLRSGARPAHVFGYCPFASSKLYGKLTGMVCTGHFVDLPLTSDVDAENRAWIARDQDLFGAFFRPVYAGKTPQWLEGVDEFSPLVEAVLAPALTLAELTQGMEEVFERWQRWVRQRNDGREAATFRRSYGSPACFAEFVRDELVMLGHATPRAALAAVEALLMNLRIAEQRSPDLVATAMASYRSASASTLGATGGLSLGTVLARGAVLECLALDYDVSSAIQGQPTLNYVETPYYLVWSVSPQGDVRLLSVDAMVYEILRSLEKGPLTVAEWMIANKDNSLDADALLSSLNDAHNEHLVRAM